MTTPRIEEMAQKMTDIIANIAFNSGKGLNSNELNAILEQVKQALTQAHQAGIEEERERIRKEPALINHPDLDTLYISTDDTI